MENRDRIIELLTAVRYTTNDIEKVADGICSLFNVVGQSEQLKAFLQEIENDKSYIHNQYFKNKAKTLRERL